MFRGPVTSCKLYEEILPGVNFSLNFFPVLSDHVKDHVTYRLTISCSHFGVLLWKWALGVCTFYVLLTGGKLCAKNWWKQWPLVFTRLLCIYFLYFKGFEYLHGSFFIYSHPVGFSLISLVNIYVYLF